MKKYFYIVLAVLLLGAAVYIKGCMVGRKSAVPSQTAPTVLPPNEQAEVLYDDDTHVITTVTRTATKRSYADDPTIHFHNDGTLDVETHSFGTVLKPFIGGGYGDGLRLYGGMSFYHLWRVNLNCAIGIALSKSEKFVVPVLGPSYNFYGNMDLFIGVNPLELTQIQTKAVPSYLHAGLIVRFW